MKKKELVPGVKYAVITRAVNEGRVHRKGIPDCDFYFYFGESHPGVKSRKDQVLMYRRYGTDTTIKIQLIRTSAVWGTEEKYVALTDEYDDRASRRAQINERAAAYLCEQMQLLYARQDVSFDSEDGVFRVSPKTMAELHGMPVPGTIEVSDVA